MPFSQKQQELIEKHLYPDEVEGEQPTADVKVTRRDLRFLLQAIQYYHDNCCPGEIEEGYCSAVRWGEDVHTGALESVCAHRCEDWINELLSPEVLANFPARGK
ncbi:MAG: hypothetical protein M1401_05235 [Chloroflexi bacterium]|nr:hypothetical protein [Chloroflexota bacterium]